MRARVRACVPFVLLMRVCLRARVSEGALVTFVRVRVRVCSEHVYSLL